MVDDGRRFVSPQDVPIDEVVPAKWRGAVIGKDGRVNRISCELCVLSQLRESIRAKEIWIVGADRYRNPDDDLPKDFETKRAAYYSNLNLTPDRARGRAGPPRRRGGARGMVREPARSRPGAPDLHLRDRRQHEDGSLARTGAARAAPARRHSARPLENHDLRRRPALRRHDTPMVLDGPTNREAFIAYASQVLARRLTPGDIVIMDNLPAHKGDAVRQAIKATVAAFVFLPPYSPTAPTSTRSRTPSPSSRRSCKKPPSEPSKASGKRSGRSSRPLHPKNAETTSRPQAMIRNNVKML